MDRQSRYRALDIFGGIFFAGFFILASWQGSILFGVGCFLAAIAFGLSMLVGTIRADNVGDPIYDEDPTFLILLGRLLAILAAFALIIAVVAWMGWI